MNNLNSIPNLNFPRLTTFHDHIPDRYGYSYRGYFLELEKYYSVIDSKQQSIFDEIKQKYPEEFESDRETTHFTVEDFGCEHFTFDTNEALKDIIFGNHEIWNCWNCIDEYQNVWESLADSIGVTSYAGFGQKYVGKYLCFFKYHTIKFGIADWLEIKKPESPKPLLFSFTVEQAKVELNRIKGLAAWSDEILAIKNIEEISRKIINTPSIQSITSSCELAVYWMKISELLNLDFILFIPNFHIKNLFEEGWWFLESAKQIFQKE